MSENRTMEPTAPECFVIDNARSIAAMSKNGPGVENAGESYRLLILELLKPKGWVLKSEVREAILRNYGSSFGPDDLRLKRVGRHGFQPKWQNTFDWAVVQGRRRGEFVANRQIIVSTALVKMLAGIQSLRTSSMVKYCDECGTASPLSAPFCTSCLTEYPTPTDKRLRIPLPKGQRGRKAHRKAR